MSEITKVYLASKAPLTPQQEKESLESLRKAAESKFRIEIQGEVFAHTVEETFTFVVRRIEPRDKFYGVVDENTIFEIMHGEEKKTVPEINLSPPTLEDNAPLKLTEFDRLMPFIDELEALRLKHNISWGCLNAIVYAIDKFGDETATSL